jgi:hypothetical protein
MSSSGPPDAPDAPKRRRLWFRAACAVAPFVAILLVAAVAMTTASHTSRPTAAATTSTSTTSRTAVRTVASTAVTTAPASGSDETSIGAPGPPNGATTESTAADTAANRSNEAPTDAAGVAAWEVTHATLLSELHSDVVTVGTDVTNGELSSLPGDCAQFASNVQVAQSVSAVPDPSAAALWSQALADFGQAVDDCTHGTDLHDTSSIAEAATEANAGGSALATLSQEGKAGG